MDRTVPTPTQTPAMSAADERAHAAASYVRSVPTDSDPDADELLNRARNPRTPSRTISSIPRRDVRTAVSTIRGW